MRNAKVDHPLKESVCRILQMLARVYAPTHALPKIVHAGVQRWPFQRLRLPIFSSRGCIGLTDAPSKLTTTTNYY